MRDRPATPWIHESACVVFPELRPHHRCATNKVRDLCLAVLLVAAIVVVGAAISALGIACL